MFSLRWLSTAAVAVSVIGAGSAQAAVAPRVVDESKFFSAGAIEKADQKIKEIDRDYKKDLLVETLPAIPEKLQLQFKEQGKQKFFAQWAGQQDTGGDQFDDRSGVGGDFGDDGGGGQFAEDPNQMDTGGDFGGGDFGGGDFGGGDFGGGDF